MRIPLTFIGGPLDGHTIPHALWPDNPEEPTLRRAMRCLDGTDTDMTAAGFYHLEARPLPPVEQLEGAPEPAQFEYVAVHHQGEQDEAWHVVEMKEGAPVPVVAEVEERKRKPIVLKLPDNHPAMRRARMIAAALEHQKENP